MEDNTCTNLDEAIEQYKILGYRLDMIFPADAPREAVVSKNGEVLRLIAEKHPTAEAAPLLRKEGSWKVGRAGMMYRDLIPDRLGGKVNASHIRLSKGGEVPDYVHYHKVGFQMIYCVKGRIRVVYEDQGEPFWLESGDCVLQPPEIRHRVLDCTAGAEVIEVSMPAEHETWVDHEMTLPDERVDPTREFSDQRFVRHIAVGNAGQDRRDLGISDATGGRCKAFVQKITVEEVLPANYPNERTLFFRLNHTETLAVELESLR